jgi:Rad3-related DNA helicase
VCFFPSYEYEKHVFEHWAKNGIISKLEMKKKVGFIFLKSVKHSLCSMSHLQGAAERTPRFGLGIARGEVGLEQ